MERFFSIGEIVNSHGIKGDVKIFPTTYDITRFELLDEVYLFRENEKILKKIENLRYHKKFVILKFRGINSMNEAETLKGYTIKIPENMALELEEDEYYLQDLFGLDVFLEDGEKLGVLDDIIHTGANDVYIVRKEATKDLLIPAIKQCILDVDLEKKIMTVRLLEGLR